MVYGRPDGGWAGRFRAYLLNAFKVAQYIAPDHANTELFESPTGMYIAIRPAFDKDGWIVRVLNFATWQHQTYAFPDEAAARRYAVLWRI